MRKIGLLCIGLFIVLGALAQDEDWYYTHETIEPDQPKFQPAERLVYTLKNTTGCGTEEPSGGDQPG